jgi:long-subunit fatty acid transport protein
MRNRIIAFVLVICIMPASGLAQSGFSKTGMTAATFLSIEIGPRAVAMGGAYVAIADDPTAMYWNPAGLEKINGNSVLFSHTSWLAETNVNYLGAAIPLGQYGTVGVSVTALSVPEMKVRTVSQPEGTGEFFDANDLAIGLSYSRSIIERFQVGINVKYIQQQIYNMTASTAAVDFGILFTTGLNNMVLGFSMSNFGGNMQLSGDDARVEVDLEPDEFGNNDRILALLETQQFQLPLIMRIGVAMDIFKTEGNLFKLAMDAVVPNDNSQYLNLGGEYVFMNLIALRAGYKTLFLEDSEEGLTLGFGIDLELSDSMGLMVDYSYADFGMLNNIQQLGVGFSF